MVASPATLLTDEDVAQLRHDIYAKQNVTRADFERVLAAGRAAGVAAPEDYAELLSDVAVDLFVWQVDPLKYVSQDDADWLTATLRAGAGLSDRTELTMLVDVLRYAVSVPASLSAFAVKEIEAAIVAGHKAAGGVDHAPGVVTHEDLEALRNAVYAGTDGSSLHVMRDEAEALFRIAHATAGAANDPAFDDFFAKAVGNYLMGVAFHGTPSAAEELRKEQWLDTPPQTPSLGDLLASLSAGDLSLGSMLDATKSVGEIDDERLCAQNAANALEAQRAVAIEPVEASWLFAHLAREGELTSAENRLIQFLAVEAPALPPGLAPMGHAA